MSVAPQIGNRSFSQLQALFPFAGRHDSTKNDPQHGNSIAPDCRWRRGTPQFDVAAKSLTVPVHDPDPAELSTA